MRDVGDGEDLPLDIILVSHLIFSLFIRFIFLNYLLALRVLFFLFFPPLIQLCQDWPFTPGQDQINRKCEDDPKNGVPGSNNDADAAHRP